MNEADAHSQPRDQAAETASSALAPHQPAAKSPTASKLYEEADVDELSPEEAMKVDDTALANSSPSASKGKQTFAEYLTKLRDVEQSLRILRNKDRALSIQRSRAEAKENALLRKYGETDAARLATKKEFERVMAVYDTSVGNCHEIPRRGRYRCTVALGKRNPTAWQGVSHSRYRPRHPKSFGVERYRSPSPSAPEILRRGKVSVAIALGTRNPSASKVAIALGTPKSFGVER
ncbi:unnamed protein product, partial [Mesorhabditis spiculigera]